MPLCIRDLKYPTTSCSTLVLLLAKGSPLPNPPPLFSLILDPFHGPCSHLFLWLVGAPNSKFTYPGTLRSIHTFAHRLSGHPFFSISASLGCAF